MWPVARREEGAYPEVDLAPTTDAATGQIRRNPSGGSSFSARLRCSLLTDPLKGMLVARASSGGKIPRRERYRNYAHDHLVVSMQPEVPLTWILSPLRAGRGSVHPSRIPCSVTR